MITLTDTATVKVKELLEAEGASELALRVAVKPGGCSGFSYEMFFDGDIAADDEQATFGDASRSSSIRRRPSSWRAQHSTTRTGSTSPGSRSRTPTPPARAGAGRAFPDQLPVADRAETRPSAGAVGNRRGLLVMVWRANVAGRCLTRARRRCAGTVAGSWGGAWWPWWCCAPSPRRCSSAVSSRIWKSACRPSWRTRDSRRDCVVLRTGRHAAVRGPAGRAGGRDQRRHRRVGRAGDRARSVVPRRRFVIRRRRRRRVDHVVAVR